MKKLNYLIFFLIFINISLLSVQKVYSNNLYPSNMSLKVSGLDESEYKDIVAKKVLDNANNNNIEFYTIDGKMIDYNPVTQYYTSFTNPEDLQNTFEIQNDTMLLNQEFLANYDSKNEKQKGHIDKYIGGKLELWNLKSLEHKTLNRIYYFPSASQKEIENIVAILNEYSINSVLDTNNGFNYTLDMFFTIFYLLLLLMILFTVQIILDGKEVVIKLLNGYSLYNIKSELIHSLFKKLLYVNFICLFLIIILTYYISSDMNFVFKIVKNVIIMDVFFDIIIVALLFFCFTVASNFIKIGNFKSGISSRYVIITTFLAKMMLLSILCFTFSLVYKELGVANKVKGQLEKWNEVEDFYYTGYSNDLSDPYDHVDFETMVLTDMDEESKKFIKKTEDAYNGVVIDAKNYEKTNYEINKNTCEGVYSLDCNTVILNQNYLDLNNSKDINENPINIDDNDKIDIIVPYEMSNNQNVIVNSVKDTINSISPLFNYSIDDFNVTIGAENSCYETYNTLTVEPCISTAGIELGDFYYNYSYLLVTGGYFININNEFNPYEEVEQLLIENDLDYHFTTFDSKTGQIYSEYSRITKKINYYILILVFSVIILITVSYYTIKMHVLLNQKEIAINIVHGKNIYMINKKIIITNIVLNIFLILMFYGMLNAGILLCIVVLDNVILYQILKKISNKNTINYIKGYND